MKDKILTFIIGVLIGAIIATVGYYFYSKNNIKGGERPNGAPPQMTQDGNNTGMPNGTPPELPNGEETNSTDGNSTNTQENDQTQTNS